MSRLTLRLRSGHAPRPTKTQTKHRPSTALNNGDDESQPRIFRLRPRQAPQPVSEMMDAVIAAVLKFSGGVQADDIKLVVARRR
jgi:hypothetical protein